MDRWQQGPNIPFNRMMTAQKKKKIEKQEKTEKSENHKPCMVNYKTSNFSLKAFLKHSHITKSSVKQVLKNFDLSSVILTIKTLCFRIRSKLSLYFLYHQYCVCTGGTLDPAGVNWPL